MAMATDLMNPDVRARIASRLLTIFGEGDDNAGREVPITQADIALLCNVSRKTINLELGWFAKTGAIAHTYGRLRLLDPEKLAGVAQGLREFRTLAVEIDTTETGSPPTKLV
jgi:CRP-like cAMP-binding protein